MVHGVRWASRGLGFQPYEGTICGDQDLSLFCNRSLPYDVVIAHIVPEYFPSIVQSELGKTVIGYTVWESDKLPPHWPLFLNACSHVVVPSEWNRKIFLRNGVKRPIHVIPHILPEITESISDLENLSFECLRPDDFVFYTIGTWTTRKAIWNTVHAFLTAFSAADPAVLIIKTTARDFTRVYNMLSSWERVVASGLQLIGRIHVFRGLVKRLESLYAQTRTSLRSLTTSRPDQPRILLCTDEWPRNKIERLHRRGDCFVSLCHSEGWGLGAFEAAALGKPVIITGFGGHLEFLPSSLAYLVEYDLVPVDDPTGSSSYTPDQNWAAPHIEHGAQLMRRVFMLQEETRQRGQLLRKHIRENFNEGVIMQKYCAVLGEL
jgi:glycosyltransferase involved in cell wall biosynthesis